jgi:hypothetical protein
MKYAITLIALALSLYVAIAGYQGTKTLQQNTVSTSSSNTGKTFELNGIVFRDEQSLMEYVAETQASHWFGWVFAFPTNLILLIGCMAAGMFGGAMRVLIQLPKNYKKTRLSKVLVDPFIGLGLGVLLFFFSLALPAVFTTGSNPVRPETALVFAMSGGMFSEQAYKWLESQVSRLIFNRDREEKEKP